MIAVSKQFFLPFIKKEHLTKDTYSFYFDRSNTDFTFLPGQYIRLTLPHENADERGTSRFFTIASSPLEKDHLVITTKLPQSTFKKTLNALEPGQVVSFFGPMGKFVLDETDLGKRVFIAGGIGITPFYSMVKYADKKKLQIPMTLFAFFSAREDMIFHDELMEISKRNHDIQIIYSLDKVNKWDKLLDSYVSDWKTAQYYVVGAPTMVAQTRDLLEAIGLSSQVTTEDFTGY